MIKNKGNIFWLFIITIIVNLPLITSNLVGQLDGNAHLYRMVSFIEAINCGQFPPRYAHRSLLGVGAPVFIYNWITPYFIVWFFYKLGFSLLMSVKFFFLLTNILATLGFYLFSKKLFSVKVALLGTVAYTYMPYRLVTAYNWGAWGQMMFLALLPWLLLFIYYFFHKKNILRVILSFVLLEFLILTSHPALLIIFFPLLLIYTLWVVYTSGHFKRIFPLILSTISGFLMASFNLFPLLFEKKLLHLLDVPTLDFLPFVPFGDAFGSIFVFGLPFLRKLDVGTYSYGVVVIMTCLLLVFYAIFSFYKKKFRNMIVLLLLFVIALIVIFLSTPSSKTIWETFTLYSLILYPVRFISVAGFIFALMLTYLAHLFKLNNKSIILAILLMITSLSYLQSYLPDHPYFSDDNLRFPQPPLYSYESGTNMGVVDFLPPIAASKINDIINHLGKNPSFYEMEKGDADVSLVDSCGSDLVVRVNAKKDSELVFGRVDFPSWEVKLDDKIIPHSSSSLGFIKVNVPSGNHKVNLTFGTTMIEKTGNVISAITVPLFIILLFLAFIP